MRCSTSLRKMAIVIGDQLERVSGNAHGHAVTIIILDEARSLKATSSSRLVCSWMETPLSRSRKLCCGCLRGANGSSAVSIISSCKSMRPGPGRSTSLWHVAPLGSQGLSSVRSSIPQKRALVVPVIHQHQHHTLGSKIGSVERREANDWRHQQLRTLFCSDNRQSLPTLLRELNKNVRPLAEVEPELVVEGIKVKRLSPLAVDRHQNRTKRCGSLGVPAEANADLAATGTIEQAQTQCTAAASYRRSFR